MGDEDHRLALFLPEFEQQVLQPDTAYVYEADVKGTYLSVSLYWQSDIGRYYEIDKKYDDDGWTHLTYVFITPHWDGQPRPAVGFHPLLMKAAGEAWIKGLRLSEFRAP